MMARHILNKKVKKVIQRISTGREQRQWPVLAGYHVYVESRYVDQKAEGLIPQGRGRLTQIARASG